MYTDEYTDYTPHSVADALSWAQFARNEYADEIVSKHEYYGSGLSGWKQSSSRLSSSKMFSCIQSQG